VEKYVEIRVPICREGLKNWGLHELHIKCSLLQIVENNKDINSSLFSMV
jgi:hypothetical protein